MSTLKEEMPNDFSSIDKSWRFADVEVTVVHSSIEDGDAYERWPGPQRNVHFWVELENGHAVAWNENPSRGYSFPSIKLKK